MQKKRIGAAKSMKAEGNVSSVRATISFPPDVYETLRIDGGRRPGRRSYCTLRQRFIN